MLRLGIFLGFATFFFMEKTLRVLSGGDDESPAHSHSHSHSAPAASTATATSVNMSSLQNGLRKRSSADPDNSTEPKSSTINQAVPASAGGPSKLSAYLNLFGDFVHNM